MLLVGFHKDLLTDRYSSICLLTVRLLLLGFETVNNWFHKNFIILNSGKSHYTCLGKNLNNNKVLNINNLTIKKSREVEILGIKIDNDLNFNNHIKSICRKAGQK